jgi:hypothetical protein
MEGLRPLSPGDLIWPSTSYPHHLLVRTLALLPMEHGQVRDSEED